VIAEISRVLDAADALAAGAWPRAGYLMYASHESLRHDFNVSCSELDLVVGLAREMGPENGIYGCRMTGGGFGGCCVALVKSGRAAGIARALGQRYAAETGKNPTMFVSRPSQGARQVDWSEDDRE
jgi:galactokinase